MIEKEGEVERQSFQGICFLNKEDKKTAKSDLQNFFFDQKGSESQRKTRNKKTKETNNKKDERNDKSKNTQIRE